MGDRESGIEELRRRSWLGRLLGYARLTGPGYLQSAMTLGSGTAAACLLSGWKYGYKLLWVQPLAMLLGVIVFAAIAKQTLNSPERPYAVFWNRLHPFMALAWGLSALAASIIWHFPQYGIAASSLCDLLKCEAGLDSAATTTGRLVVGFSILAFCIPLSWMYSRRGPLVRLYERFVKLMVWGMVLAFAWVAVATGIRWGELFKGLFGFYIPSPRTEPDGVWILLGGLSAAVGINMVFLYPYSLRQRNWGREHEGLAYYDLATGMLIPFTLASILVIAATANTIHGTMGQKPASMVNLIPIMSEQFGARGAAAVLGLGLFAMGLSSITVQMLAAGFTACEILGLRPEGWPYRLCMLLPTVGVAGSVVKLPLSFAVYVSAGMVFFLPLTYIGFMILNNMASYLGEAMPRGPRRWLWNTGLLVAIGVVTFASLFTAYHKIVHLRPRKPAGPKKAALSTIAPENARSSLDPAAGNGRTPALGGHRKCLTAGRSDIHNV